MFKSRSVRILAAACLAALIPAFSLASTLGEVAKRAGKPMIVDFGMTRCWQCIEEGKVMEKLKTTLGSKAEIRFVHVGNEEALAEEYKILMIPAILFLDRAGREVFRNVGFMDHDALMKKIAETGLLK